MKRMGSICMIVAIAAFLVAGCSTAPKSAAGKAELTAKVQRAKDDAIKSDPGLKKFFDEAAGYAVFPTVVKAAEDSQTVIVFFETRK